MLKSTRVLVEVAILVTLAFVIEFGFSFLPAMPQGGRVSLSLLPLIVIAWRHGVVPGIIGGVVYSILNLMLDGFVLYHWGSLFLDYVFAFGLIGLSGYVKTFKDDVLFFAIAIVAGFFLRFTSHVLSGAILFGEYAPEGQNPWLYSIIYNSTYLLPALVLTVIVGIPVFYALQRYFNEEIYN